MVRVATVGGAACVITVAVSTSGIAIHVHAHVIHILVHIHVQAGASGCSVLGLLCEIIRRFSKTPDLVVPRGGVAVVRTR